MTRSTIESSRLFQLDWYCNQAKQAFSLDDAIQHYLDAGASQGLNPNPYFHTRWYGESYPDVTDAGLNPLVHYILWGEAEGRPPSEIFDPLWYLRRYKDVEGDPMAHFLAHGLKALRNANSTPIIGCIVASGLFQLDWYNKLSGLSLSEKHAVRHYLVTGADKGLNPNALFDSLWYLDQNPEVAKRGLNPLHHYIEAGERNGLKPSERFDPSWYLAFYEDVAVAKISPLAHYLRDGANEGRHPSFEALLVSSPLFQDEWYSLQIKRALSRPEAVQHYIQHGAKQGLWPNAFFDPRWYLKNNPDVAQAGVDPLLDYIRSGEQEGRAPSDAFDPAWYLKRYRDVTHNPLAHFLLNGQREKRQPSLFAQDGGKKERLSSVGSVLLPTDTKLVLRLEFELGPLAATAIKHEWPVVKTGWTSAQRSQDLPNSAFPHAPVVVKANNVGLLGGSRYLFTAEGRVVDDELLHFSDPDVAIKRHHVTRTGNHIWMPIARRYGTRVSRGVHLMHEYDTNYFHFVSEVLPRAIVALEAPGIAPETPFLVTEGLHPNFRELLRSVVGERPLLELESGTLFHAEELWYATDVSTVQDIYTRPRKTSETALHLHLIRLVRDRFLAANGLGSRQRRGRKIYVHRGKRVRGARNERDICDALVARGFETLVLDDLSVRAQATIFSEAEIVVAPTGAAVTNLIWCAPDTPAIVMASDHPAMPSEVWQQLAKVSGCRLEVTAERRAYVRDDIYAMHDDYDVDLAGLLSKIDRALNRQTAIGE